MVEKTKYKDFDVYTIISANGGTRASFVPEKGGAGSSIVMQYNGKGKELLFLYDHFWRRDGLELPGGSPFLFPICGRLERMGNSGDYLYDGHICNMPIHGFSWFLPWQVTEHENNNLSLRLTETDVTLEMYPFHFTVNLTYKVENNKLICEQEYINTGDSPMPYYAGFHPYFLTPEAGQGKEKTILDFQPIRRFRYNERLTDLTGELEILDLPASVNDPKINEQLSEVASDNIATLSYPDGFKLAMTAYGNKSEHMFRYMQLYTIPEKPFICLEPWMGAPNALNTISGVRWLQPGESEQARLEIYSHD